MSVFFLFFFVQLWRGVYITETSTIRFESRWGLTTYTHFLGATYYLELESEKSFEIRKFLGTRVGNFFEFWTLSWIFFIAVGKVLYTQVNASTGFMRRAVFCFDAADWIVVVFFLVSFVLMRACPLTAVCVPPPPPDWLI